MRALDRKLVRDLSRLWRQSLAIALVLGCGIMVLVLAGATQRSLIQACDRYYGEHRFADVFASLTRAPRPLLSELARIDGVVDVEGRVVFNAMLDLPGNDEPTTARILSLPADASPRLNRPFVRSGRLPAPHRADEVAVSEPFALANALVPGSRISAVLNGRLRELTVTGIALSPEYVHTIAPGAPQPDDRHFGLLWMREDAAEAAKDLTGAFNDLTLQLASDANPVAVIDAVDRLLAPYGGTGAYGRDRQPSHVYVAGELKQLRAMANILPPIFLAVAAVLVNMVLGRLIALERPQIGLLKALGYRNRTLAWHYLKLTVGIAFLGIALGWGFGIWLGQGLTALYGDYFRFPALPYRLDPWAFVISGVLGLATVLAGAMRGLARITRLTPAVAMAPRTPPSFHRGGLEWLGRRLALRQISLMVLRSLTRWPGRAAVTLFGVAGSVTVLVAAFFTFDAIDRVGEEIFERANRQDITLTLASAVNARAEEDARALPGVVAAEGVFVASIRLVNGAESRLVSLQVPREDARLTRILSGDTGTQALPREGLALPEGLAQRLHLNVGDRVEMVLMSPPQGRWTVPVAAVSRQSLGEDAFMARTAFFRLLDAAPQVNLIHLDIDARALGALQAKVRETPAIAGFTRWVNVRAQFEETLNESLLTMTAVFAALGVLMTIGVIYNATRIQLAERAYEFALLKMLGFHRREVGYVLVSEQLLLTVLAIPLGWLAGYGFCALMVAQFSTEVVSVPLVVSSRTFASAALLVLATALTATLLVRRSLDDLDLVQSLKQRE